MKELIELVQKMLEKRNQVEMITVDERTVWINASKFRDAIAQAEAEEKAVDGFVQSAEYLRDRIIEVYGGPSPLLDIAIQPFDKALSALRAAREGGKGK